MPTLLPELEEAARILSLGKGESVLASAKKALADMHWAVKSITSDSPEILTRISKSTGTKRLSFVIGTFDRTPVALRANVSEQEANAVLALRNRAKEVLEHLSSRGVNAEIVDLRAHSPNMAKHAVDVVLDDRALQYTIGERTAAVVGPRGGGPVASR